MINKIFSSNPAGYNMVFKAVKLPKTSFIGSYNPNQVSIPASMRESIRVRPSGPELLKDKILNGFDKLKNIEAPTPDYIDQNRGVIVHFLQDGNIIELPVEKAGEKLTELSDAQNFEGFLDKDELLKDYDIDVDIDVTDMGDIDVNPEDGVDLVHEVLDKLANAADLV